MARGKILIQKIENPTNRQVTYSKRRNGLLKKAQELSVLCDAKVSIIILSGTGKLHEYTSESTSTKELIDLYERTSGTDLWSSQYEKMQEHKRILEEKNRNLRMQISQRMGQCLDGLNFKELHDLEQEMESAAKVIRERKYKVMSNQIDTTNKKLKRAKQINNAFLTDDIKDDPDYALLEGAGGHYNDSIAGYPNAFPSLLALGLQLNQPNFQPKAESSVITTWGVPKF
ncbi:Floral homeotic protein DEFICIENS [Morus notabilis]|uniref:Floral homeotic protein DEFICIENS n=1 Tax=Morus notabilis TaxID=981085 RepID=W9RZ14_9ROSA|nr:floral homeotic protein PMADS 1 [Morus notabilis]EXC04209.1 Floral homeotic protein DEFICIENS [Morus notabilis]